MKRIDILYGGEHYSVGMREVADLKQEIAQGLGSGMHWLAVNDGEGASRPAFLMLTPGVSITLIPIPDETGEAEPVPTDDGSGDHLGGFVF